MAEQNRITWSEVLASGTDETVYIDLPRAMSRINRKQYVQVDGQGNAQVYLIRIKQNTFTDTPTGSSEVQSILQTAPNNYVTKAAVKAWHRARVRMLERQGISLKQLSPYTRHLRVAFDGSDTNENELYVGPIELTKFAVEAQLDSDVATALTAAAMVDGYTLTLLGDHDIESTDPTTKYNTVGVNKSWLDARRQPMNSNEAAAEPATTLDHLQINHEENPLYEILAGSSIAEEVSEIVEDEQLMAPPWTNSDHYAPMTQGYLYTSHNAQDEIVIEVPLGLLKVELQELRAGGTVSWTIEVLDIYDM